MWFEKCQDLNELKSIYKKLAIKHHPDCGGDVRMMQEINAEYDRIFLLLKAKQNFAANDDLTGRTKHTTEAPEEFRIIVDMLLKLDGIEVELCGSWLWIAGSTYPHRKSLKEAGCRWSASKRKWYWRHEEDDASYSRGTATMEEIRNKYGSEWLRPKAEHVTLPA